MEKLTEDEYVILFLRLLSDICCQSSLLSNTEINELVIKNIEGLTLSEAKHLISETKEQLHYMHSLYAFMIDTE